MLPLFFFNSILQKYGFIKKFIVFIFLHSLTILQHSVSLQCGSFKVFLEVRILEVTCTHIRQNNANIRQNICLVCFVCLLLFVCFFLLFCLFVLFV